MQGSAMRRRNAAVAMRDAAMTDAAIAMMDVGAKAETATTMWRPGTVKENDVAKTDPGIFSQKKSQA